MAVAVAGQAGVRVPRRAGRPWALVEEGAAGAAVRAARVVGALAFRVLELKLLILTVMGMFWTEGGG